MYILYFLMCCRRRLERQKHDPEFQAIKADKAAKKAAKKAEDAAER